MFGFYFKLYALISFFSISMANQYHRSSEDSEVAEIDYIASALRKGLIYIRDNVEARTMDVALGMILVKGNLKWIENKMRRISHKKELLSDKINELLKLCEVIFSAYAGLQFSNVENERIIFFLLHHDFDNALAEDLKYGGLKKSLFFEMPEFESCSSIDDYALRGTPNKSDSCILELFERSCDVSEDCWFDETNKNDHSGYKTTHRLLYLQLAAKLQCEEMNPRKMKWLGSMKKSLCEQILWEASVIEEKYIFFARDLFLEQVALCGFEGHVEFAKKSWRYMIPTWQYNSGCFGFLRVERDIRKACLEREPELNQTKRNYDLDISCHSHFTAVGISAMAFHLRVAINKFLAINS